MKQKEAEAIWKLPPSGMKPGHGLFIAEHLNIDNGDTLVDLGTGPLGFLGILGAHRGAKSVFAVEANPDFLRTAQASVSFVRLDETVRILKGDLFEPVKATSVEKVVVHLPMLPSARFKDGQRAAHYDEGGSCGREVLDRAIAQAAQRMSSGGKLLIGQFEFLGVDRPFGNQPTTFELFKRHGFRPKVVASYEVAATPALLDRASLIQEIYPYYRFVLRNGKLWDRFVIISGTFLGTGGVV
jgi:methylase of polypeptide subunit release factors